MDNRSPEIYQRLQAWKEKHPNKESDPNTQSLLFDILWLLFLELAQIRQMAIGNSSDKLDEFLGTKSKTIRQSKKRKDDWDKFVSSLKKSNVIPARKIKRIPK